MSLLSPLACDLVQVDVSFMAHGPAIGLSRRSKQMKAFLAALAFALVGSGPALAAPRCNVPADQWQPRDALKSKLETEGWTVRQIKSQHGCYEAYAVDSNGNRMETFFDPKTFEAVGNDG
jgi:hypothetical protein